MRIHEIQTKTALVRSKLNPQGFVLNPYLGCTHGCRYCYAVFMRKYAHLNRHTRWGEFVEVKANIAEVLHKELTRKRKTSSVMLSSVCDPYQPVEGRYKLTQQCIALLREFGWAVRILTRSPLVLRDLELLRTTLDLTVGLSIPTDDDHIRRITEPHAPPIARRVDTLRQLHEAGIRTWVFVAPILPMDPERLHAMIHEHADDVQFDALNYRSQVAPLFRQHGWHDALTDAYAEQTESQLRRLLAAGQ